MCSARAEPGDHVAHIKCIAQSGGVHGHGERSMAKMAMQRFDVGGNAEVK